jgi:hypothetical protein
MHNTHCTMSSCCCTAAARLHNHYAKTLFAPQAHCIGTQKSSPLGAVAKPIPPCCVTKPNCTTSYPTPTKPNAVSALCTIQTQECCGIKRCHSTHSTLQLAPCKHTQGAQLHTRTALPCSQQTQPESLSCCNVKTMPAQLGHAPRNSCERSL